MAIGRGRWIFCCALAAYVQVVEHGLQEGPIRERPAASCPSNICSTAEHHYASVFAPSQAGLLSPVIEFGARRDCIRASCAEHGSSLETYQDESSRNEWISKSSRVFFKLITPELIASCGASTLKRRGRLIYRDVATSSSGLHNFCESRELGTSLQGEPGALLYS